MKYLVKVRFSYLDIIGIISLSNVINTVFHGQFVAAAILAVFTMGIMAAILTLEARYDTGSED